MSPSIGRLRVAVFEEEIGPELREVVRLLEGAGYRAMHAEEPERWRSDLERASCGVLMAYRVTRDLLPSPFGGGHVPPIVLVSPLDKEDAVDGLGDPRVVHAVLEPGVPEPAVLNAVTRAVVDDLIRRLDHAIQHHPDLVPVLRAALRQFLKGEKRRVDSAAKSRGVSPRTLEKHWAAAFGSAEPPRLADFCRGIQTLRAIAAFARDPTPGLPEALAALEMPRSTLHGLTVRYADRPPSKLDLSVDAGVTIARVLARTVPLQLVTQVLGPDDV